MTITLPDLNASIMALLQSEAAKHGHSIDREAQDILTWALIRRKSGNPSQKFKLIREMLLAQRGGVPFSDSTDIIRKSRDEDH